jgi:GGDEF domain-containing protein
VLITCVEEEARQKAAALKAAFDAAPEAVDLPPGIGLSVGLVEVPPGATDLLPLVNEADARMYRDKGARPAPRDTANDSASAVRRRRQSGSPR